MAHFDELRELLLDAARDDPRRRDVRGALQRQPASPSGACAAPASSPRPTGPPTRGAIVEVSDRGGGTIRIPNPPWHFSGADVGVRGEAEYRGEDNRAVLAEVLGYDDATIDAPRGRRGAVQPGAIIAGR